MKRFTFLTTIIILAGVLSACATGGEQREAAQRLTAGDFPTPIPAEPSPTPTPFPKAGLTLVTPTAAPVSNSDAASPTPTAQPTPEPPTATPAPYGSGTVASIGLNVRAAAGLGNPILEELRQGDPVTVMALDAASGWAKVRTAAGTIGWVNPKYLNLADDLSALHGISVSPTAMPPALSGEMTGTATAIVTSYGLNVRNGAGDIILEEIHKGDAVEILGKSESTGWVNVRTAAGTVGWVNPEFLDISGDIPAPDGAQSAAPTAHTGGRLLIQLQRGGDIVLLNRDGTDLRTLTTGIDPALSPDGERVAFSRWQGAEGTLWVINTDGTNERPVRGEIRLVKNPSWSPDSAQIAVNFQQGGTSAPTRQCANLAFGQPNINYWQAYDITQEIRIIGGQPVPFLCWWLPADTRWKLRIINVADSSFEDKPAGEYAANPVWDPANPSRVVSRTESGLVQTNVDDGTVSPLTTDVSDHAPVFSPDGWFIAVTYRQDTHWDIHRLNSDGSGRVRLTETPIWVTAVDGKPVWNNVAPVFSPDGTEIAFLTDRTGRWEVWVMGADGSNQRPMFSDAVNDRLPIEFSGGDERPLDWGK